MWVRHDRNVLGRIFGNIAIGGRNRDGRVLFTLGIVVRIHHARAHGVSLIQMVNGVSSLPLWVLFISELCYYGYYWRRCLCYTNTTWAHSHVFTRDMFKMPACSVTIFYSRSALSIPPEQWEDAAEVLGGFMIVYKGWTWCGSARVAPHVRIRKAR